MAENAPEDLINVIDPDTREIGSIPAGQLPEAMGQGFTEASPEQVQKFINQQKYGAPGQQIKTAVEGLGEGLAGPVFTAAEKAIGVQGKDILGRREENPLLHGTTQGAGLIGGMFTGAGEGALLETAGKGIAKLAGLEEAGLASKLGSKFLQGATENALFQAGDEATKAIAQDPNQSVESAVVNMGLMGLMGGGISGTFGAISPLWKATKGGELGQTLKSIRDRLSGEGIPDAINDAIQASGVQVAPEIKAAISGDLKNQAMFQALAQSDTSSGKALQESVSKLRTEIPNSIVEALGKTPEQVDALESLSSYEAGKKVQDTLIKEFKDLAGPTSKAFEDIKTKFAGAPISKDVNNQLIDQISMFAQEEGFAKNPSGPQNKFIQQVIEELPLQTTAKDLRNYISNIGKQTFGYDNPLSHVGSQVKKILGLGEEEAIARKFTKTYPERVGELAAAKESYGALRADMEALADRLHPGSYGGPGSFARLIEEMDKPETVLSRLSALKDVNLQKLLAEKFPTTFNQIKDYQLNQLLKTATKRTAQGEIINPVSFFKALDNLSPEMRESLISKEAVGKLEGARTLLESLNAIPRNFSNTAGISEMMNKYMPGTAMGMLSMLTGHNPVTSLIVGGLTKFIGKDVPDAARLAMLKFLGSNKPIESEGFKTMVDFMNHIIKGENLIGKASKNVFKAGEVVIPQSYLPDEKQRMKLDKQIKESQTNHEMMFNIGGKTAHYLPEHGTAMAQTAMNAANFINSQRPVADKQSPLDSDVKISQVQKAAYDRTLDIAQQPLVVLNHIKDGTLVPQDLIALKTIYPGLYNKLNLTLNEQLIEAVNKGEQIPYKTRMSLSLFMGQPLDSTLTPQGILSSQSTFTVPSVTPQQAGQRKVALNFFKDLASREQTPLQKSQLK